MNGTRDYTTQVNPRQVMETVNRGFRRLQNFRNARLLFLRQYVGQYYDRDRGAIGTEPLNLIFNAIRVLVPNMVMNYAKHNIETQYLQAKEYCKRLGLAMDQHDKKIDIPNVYRCTIVDAIFTLGVVKTGLCESDSIYAFNEQDRIDPGTIYTGKVDFDNYVVDPGCKEHLFADARFEGDKICIPRRVLLESGKYKNDLVERLPRAGYHHKDKKAYELSMRNIQSGDNYDLEDEVEVYEIWVPSANAVITVPACDEASFEDYLRVDEFYGVNEGPYTKLALTPPVSGNPLPVPMVGIWHDLHVRGNEMATKIIDQASRQKDIIGYKGGAADDVEELRNAKDGEAIRMEDPDAIRVHSMGGQKQSNEIHLQMLQNWFNQMAGNPQQLAGSPSGADTATENLLMSQNAQTSLGDMKDMVYKFAGAESRRRAWYFHTDPLMETPLTERKQTPAQFFPGPTGPIMVSPPTMEEVQIILTPEARTGEFFDFMFSIETESMSRPDPRARFAQAMDFCVKVIPAILTAAQGFMMLGLPFSAKAMLIKMAKLASIDWLEEIFYDPEFQMALMQQMAMGPNAAASKGQAAPGGGGPPGLAEIQQNGQPGSVGGGQPSAFGQARSQFQEGANEGQQMAKSGY